MLNVFKFNVSGTGDAFPVEYLSAYLAENWDMLTPFEHCMYE